MHRADSYITQCSTVLFTMFYIIYYFPLLHSDGQGTEIYSWSLLSLPLVFLGLEQGQDFW